MTLHRPTRHILLNTLHLENISLDYTRRVRCFVHMLRTNMEGYELVLEEVQCYMFLVFTAMWAYACQLYVF